MIEGSSEIFPTLKEATKAVKAKSKAKSKGKSIDGRRFWSDKLGIPFRSNWEVELAELMTDLGIEWEYEPRRVYFREEHESYLCDFWLPEYNCWIEVKGYMDKRSEKRCRLFRKYYGAQYGYFLYMKEERDIVLSNPEMLFTYIDIANEEQERRAGELEK